MNASRASFLLSLLLICVPFCLVVQGQSAAAGAIEIASGPEDLVKLEQKGKITVRALRGFGRLPDHFLKLAQTLRNEKGLDLLGADLEQIRQWSVEPHLAEVADQLAELAAFMEQGEYLDWSPVPEGVSIPAGSLVRSAGVRWIQSAETSGEVLRPADQPASEPAETAPVAHAQAAFAPAAPSDVGPQDGVEFPINDQVGGTYRVRLQVEGLRPVQPEEEPFFQRKLAELLPENPSVLAGEKQFFAKKADGGLQVTSVLEEGLPYHSVLGMAAVDTTITIRVDAPDQPEIALSEQEIKENVSYRVVGKSVYVYRHDEADGGADIGFEESYDGEVRWTPRADPKSGRPVGPRVLGIYMAYRVKKYVGDHELGTLSTGHHRIGWVVAAMPGDVYEHEGVLYAVGQKEPLFAEASTAPISAAEVFDFELPQFALDEKAIRLSDDLRHVAWIEGEKEGKKRAVVNGVTGSWHDDIRTYSMRFVPNGDFFYTAGAGGKSILFRNGEPGPVFDDSFSPELSLSEDGAHVLVSGKVGDQTHVYLDGKLVRKTRFSVREGVVAGNGKAAWIERGREENYGPEFAMVVTPDGTEGHRYKAIHSAPLLTRNQGDLYYIAEKEDGNRYLVRNGEELMPTMRYGYEFTVSPDGVSYAFVGHVDDKVRSMVINGQIGPDFDEIWRPAGFSPDGQRHIYSGTKNGEALLVVDGRIVSHSLGSPKSIYEVTFSPDGRRWAAVFEFSDKEYVVVVDGREAGRGQGQVRTIAFSPDGTRVAWVEGGKNSMRVVLQGKAGPEFQEIYSEEPPQFSPDGRHLVYFSMDAKERKTALHVFGGEKRTHDMVPPRAVFTDRGVEYVALDGNRLRRDVLPLP